MSVRRRRITQGVLAALAVGLLVLGLVIWSISGSVGQVFGGWAVDAVAKRSGGAYHLTLGRVRMRWFRRQVTVDSVRLTTNAEANARRTQPLSEIDVALDHCTLRKLQLVALALHSGLIADGFECTTGHVRVNGIRRPADAARVPFLVLRGGEKPPRRVTRIKVGTVDFLDLAIGVRLPRAEGGETRLALERAQWRMVDFDIDPADTNTASRPLFSRTIEVAADSFVLRPDSETSARAAHFRASLTDSTVELVSLGFGPTASDSSFLRARSYRRDIVRMRATRSHLVGFDFGAFMLGTGLRARRVVVDSLRTEVTSDKRRPPRPRIRGTPQQWIAELEQTVAVDSILIHAGTIAYREQRPDRVGPGTLTFTGIEAVAAPVHHVGGRRTSKDPTILVARATLQQAGRLDVRFVVPLDASTYDMAFAGSLGPMAAPRLNEFLERVYPWKIARGQIQRIDFDVRVRAGVARGTVTPYYRDLSIKVTGRGADGLLGTGGVIGDAARGVASAMARAKINERNPEEGKPAASGTVAYTFTQRETLVGFVWHSLRQGLLAIVRKE